MINGAGGNWAEYAVIPWKQARRCRQTSPTIRWLPFSSIRRPYWRWWLRAGRSARRMLLQSAGSALGKMVIRYCKHEGIKTINVVRRRAAMAELKELGATSS